MQVKTTQQQTEEKRRRKENTIRFFINFLIVLTKIEFKNCVWRQKKTTTTVAAMTNENVHNSNIDKKLTIE